MTMVPTINSILRLLLTSIFQYMLEEGDIDPNDKLF